MERMFGYPIYIYTNKPIIQWSVRNVKTSHTSIWKCKQLLYTGPKTSWKHRKKWRISRETFILTQPRDKTLTDGIGINYLDGA